MFALITDVAEESFINKLNAFTQNPHVNIKSVQFSTASFAMINCPYHNRYSALVEYHVADTGERDIKEIYE